jgi:phosphoenolpyruvate carboxylase
VKLEFYYGRGGNPIRGGGSTERAVNSLAAGSFNHPHHLTEQGEVLARYYSIPEMAEMRLEQALMAVLKKAKNDDTRTGQTTTAAAPLQLFETLSERSKRHYQALIAQPGFVKFYNHLTPNETKYIHRGSRPSTRYQSEESFENIRAIPWVFQWTQSRVLLPGWYGLGTAMADMADMAKSEPRKNA